MEKYFKNSLMNLVFGIIIIMYLLFIIPICFVFEFETHVMLLTLIGGISPFILYFIVGFYWVFQSISIDEAGISFYLLRRKLADIKWDEIESIELKYFKIGHYSIKLKNKNKYYNFNATKKLKSLMESHAPKELSCIIHN